MPTEKKRKLVEDITSKLSKAEALIFSDYSGLGVNDLNDLREKLTAVDADFQVVKNNLLKIALKNTKNAPTSNVEAIKGPTATLFCYKDPLAPLKVLVEFAKVGAHHDAPLLKLGIIEGQLLSSEELTELAKIPSREGLLGQVANILASPITGFINVLNGNQRNLVYVLSRIATNRMTPFRVLR